MRTIKNTLIQSVKQLSYCSGSAVLDAELLLCSVINKERTYLHAWPDKEITQEQDNLFENLISRRTNGEPIAYILGERGFWTLNLKVTTDTLIPRPDTERLVELALDLIPKDAPCKILDLGTGTGAIALSLAKERSESFITATDQSAHALDIAIQNAKNNDISNIEFIQSNWFSNLGNRQFDIIVSNPPYIKENDPHLTQGDVRFEPLSALTAGKDGLNDIREIIEKSKNFLSSTGILLIEHGYDQAIEVCELLKKAHFSKVKNLLDYNDNPRVSIGYAHSV